MGFFIRAKDNSGNYGNSSLYSYTVKSLILGDANRVGKVDIMDIAMVAINFGKGS